MGQPARLLFPVTELTRPQLLALPSWSDVGLRFQSLILTEPLLTVTVAFNLVGPRAGRQ